MFRNFSKWFAGVFALKIVIMVHGFSGRERERDLLLYDFVHKTVVKIIGKFNFCLYSKNNI
jgi:hypothetical protein